MISVKTLNGCISVQSFDLLKFPYFVNTMETMGTLEGISIPFTSESLTEILKPKIYNSDDIDILDFLLVDTNTLICYDIDESMKCVQIPLIDILKLYPGLRKTKKIEMPSINNSFSIEVLSVAYSDKPIADIYKGKIMYVEHVWQLRSFNKVDMNRYLPYFYEKYYRDDIANSYDLDLCSIKWLIDNECKNRLSKIIRLFNITHDEICLIDIPKPDNAEQLLALDELHNSYECVYKKVSEYFVKICNK